MIHQPAGSDETGAVVVEAVDFDFLGEFLRRIPDLDIEPEQVHQRVACFFGSADDVNEMRSYYKK